MRAVNIIRAENGWFLKVENVHKQMVGKIYVFPSAKELGEWMSENLDELVLDTVIEDMEK